MAALRGFWTSLYGQVGSPRSGSYSRPDRRKRFFGRFPVAARDWPGFKACDSTFGGEPWAGSHRLCCRVPFVLMPPSPIPVVVAGALGRMGAEVVKAVSTSGDCVLVGAIDTAGAKEGVDVGEELGLGPLDVAVTADFEGCLCQASQAVRQHGPEGAAVLVDFTHPSVVFEHTRAAIAYGVHPVIGTTGLAPQQLADLVEFAAKAGIGGAVIPNFSVGMVLLQQAAAAAARFYDSDTLNQQEVSGLPPHRLKLKKNAKVGFE